MDNEKVADGVSKLLLAPMYLVYDLLTALLPGILFGALLLGKGLHAPTAALSSTLLGYKVKMALGLLLCYVMGRLFRTPVELVLSWLSEREMKKLAVPPLNSQTADFVQNFLIGALGFTELFMKVQPLDILVLMGANLVFSLTTGAVLLVAAAIPGDGYVRIAEAAAGIVMLVSVLTRLRAIFGAFVALAGGLVDLPTILGPLAAISALLKKSVHETGVQPAKTETPASPTSPQLAPEGTKQS